jgi:hypothetical protein
VATLTDPIAVSYLIARHLPPAGLERQPGGGIEYVDRFSEERRKHIHALAWWLLRRENAEDVRIAGYQEIVSQYMLGGKSIDRIRALLKMDMNKVSGKRKACENRLKDLDQHSHLLVENSLIATRILTDR